MIPFIAGTDSGEILVIEGIELRYTFNSDSSQPVTYLVSTSKGFIAATAHGAVLVYERDEKEGFQKIKSLTVPNPARIATMAVSPMEEFLAVSLDNNQLLTLPINAVELLRVRLKPPYENAVYVL